MTNNRYCSHCGYERAERERFCAKCGIPFADMDYELGLPFDLPSVAFASELDEEEQLCVERESSYFDKSVMRGSAFFKGEDMATFNQANVTNGVYKAAQAKFKRDQDYQGAKS